MAINVYLKIDGIKGEPQDDKHKDWIQCESVNWAMSQPRSATASTGGGHTAGRVDLEDVTFFKVADLASPIFAQTCCSGKTIAKAKFQFMRADAQGARIKYFEIELENVLISNVAPGVPDGSIMGQNIALKFSKVEWKYTQQKVTGGACGNTSGGWDLASNKIA